YPGREADHLVQVVLGTDAWDQDVVELQASLVADGVILKVITQGGPVLLLQGNGHTPAVGRVVDTQCQRFGLVGIQGGDAQAQTGCWNGAGNDRVGIHRGLAAGAGTVGDGGFQAIDQATGVFAEGFAPVQVGAEDGA